MKKKVEAQTKMLKTSASGPVEAGSPSLPAETVNCSGVVATQPKRGRGRPRKNPLSTLDTSELVEDHAFTDKKTGKSVKDGRELVVFRKMIADAEKAQMADSEFDGGGTAEAAPAVTKDSLLRRVTRRLNVLDRFLTDDKLIELLAFSSLKEIGVYEGIMLDKSMVLQGQPTVIIGNDERKELRDTLPRLMEELKRRGLINQSAQPKMLN